MAGHTDKSDFPTEIELNRLTNFRLHQLARRNHSNEARLVAIQTTLIPRTSQTAERPRRFIADRLAKLRPRSVPNILPKSTVAHPKPGTGAWKYLLAALGIVAAGVGQAAGSQFWNTLWPAIRNIGMGH